MGTGFCYLIMCTSAICCLLMVYKIVDAITDKEDKVNIFSYVVVLTIFLLITVFAFFSAR